MTELPDYSTKHFRFNPKDYNTTFRIVKNVHHGNATLMANGDIIIEYILDSSIPNFFFLLQLHTPTPEDIDPPVSPKDVRNQKNTAIVELYVQIFSIVFAIAMLIYCIYLFFTR